MATRIKHKRSSVAGKQPIVSQLESGELAINTADGKVFLLRDDNTVQDITKRIFENNSEIVVNDPGDSVGAITVTVDGVDKILVTPSGISLQDDTTVEDAGYITFKELTASGNDGIGIKAPNTLDAGYNLTLPSSIGVKGNLLKLGASNQLEFTDADAFGGNVVYVSAEQGDDANDGRNEPVKTVKRACQVASGLVYNADGTINGTRINIKVAVGDYTEQNPIVVPDNVVIKGDGLRGCIIRPANEDQDMLRVRNACYFGEFTFRDGVDANFVPIRTWGYAVAFDDPTDVTVSRVGYTNLPTTRPNITTSPYIQNTSMISFLGGSGARIDGSLVNTPNTPIYAIEAENPVIGATPEQGKSMVANAFTHISFGGTGWRLTNDAYAQLVSCFQIFLLNGVYCQSGGYCSITNSATNFGLYALRSSGYSAKTFDFDRSYVIASGLSSGERTISVVGINREEPVQEFIVRFRDPDLKIAYDLIQSEKGNIAQDTVNWINTQVSGAASSIWTSFSYNEEKCRRDVGYLLDAIKWDIMFDSNYRTVASAIRYYAASAAAVVGAQKDQTIAAFGQAKTLTVNALSNATMKTRAGALWDEVIDVVTNGEGAADAYSYPNPTDYNTSYLIGYGDARAQLIANKTFIQDEVDAWIAVQVASEIAPFTSSFTYSAETCRRDTGLLIDALVYDLTYGGNLQTYDAALAYFIGAIAQYGAGKKAETIASYLRLKEVIEQVIAETTVTASTGNSTAQDTAGTAGSAGSITFAGDRIQEIADFITNDGTGLTRIEPGTAWVSATFVTDATVNLSATNILNISQNVTQWINEQIQNNLWYNFTYDQAKCLRDTLLILDAVARDTWSTGNALTRQSALAYYNGRLADSATITISGQELQTIAAIEQASVYTAAVVAALNSSTKTKVDSLFDIVKEAIADPESIPDALDVSATGDITNDFKTAPTETEFNPSTDVNPSTDTFTIIGHGFTNLQAVVYDSNSNPKIGGLDTEQTYYVGIINEDEFTLFFDESGNIPVNILSVPASSTHKFLTDITEFFVKEILSSHTVYQRLILASSAASAEFVPGRAISAATGAVNNSATVYSWKPTDLELIVSVELVASGTGTVRNQFSDASVIAEDHASSPNTAIDVNEVSPITSLGTATFTIKGTIDGIDLTNLSNLPESQCWFHRPSIVNSSSHTWEYAGSGIDYNALPQNGGNTVAAYEQYSELPGRVYSSGTNELGDFKVGNFITAFNRTGNITFQNKVTVDTLDALRLSLSSVAIEEISTDVNLGDNELGGPSDSRLSTQLAMRSFLSNRLGGFIDKSVSTAAVPGAIVQLNTNGQLNPDLIPATRQFTSTTTNGYRSKLRQVDNIPAVDLKAGDIATEEYEQIELTFASGVTAADGALITQATTGAQGYAKGTYTSSLNLLVASVGAEFKAGDDSTGTDFDTGSIISIDGVSTSQAPTELGSSSGIVDNYFLKSSISSQYLVLSNDDDYTLTADVVADQVTRTSNVATIRTETAHDLQVGNTVQVITTVDTTFSVNGTVLSTPTTTTFTISNVGSDKVATSDVGTVRTIVTSADGNAQGAVTETRYGVLTNVDNATITGGSGYTPASGTLTYSDVAFSNNTGVGVGATCDVTVNNGTVTDVDIKTGGTGYAIGDILSVESNYLGEDSAGAGFEIEVTAIEKRAYVNILGGELFVASTSSVDFVEDNTAPAGAITTVLTDVVSTNFLAGDSGSGGAVDYSLSRISITTHGLTNGDPLTYDTLSNVSIGGLMNGSVYYAKAIDPDVIELYADFSLLNKILFTSTPSNNNHNITRHNVNITDNSVIVLNHGYNTGDAVSITGSDLFQITATTVPSRSRFFIGSKTTNSFTLHELRSDALASINSLVVSAKDITAKGTGNAIYQLQSVQVNSVVNTSSRLNSNWNSLAATNIDASNIISGTVSPTRLASSGVANTDSFLRGDSSYQTVVQSLKKSTTTDNPITLTGSNVAGEFYGDPVNIGISNVDNDIGAAYSTLGVARFLQAQFDVDVTATGQVFIKDGVVDAGTLDALDSAYFLNPANLTSAVPVSRGGTAITTYAIGDLIYAQSTGALNTINIGRNNSFLKSNGTNPEWGTALDLAQGLDVGSARLTSTSTGTGKVYNENVTSLELGSAASAVKIGTSSATRNIKSFALGFEATSSTDVAVNLASNNVNTNGAVANGENEVPMTSTSGILTGMLVTGSGNIPSNTTVSGVTTEYIYLSVDTVGSIISGTTLTFTYTPETLGIRAGDTVNLGSTGITNLDGSWPVSGATFNATSFTVRTDLAVTANAGDAIAGGATITKDNTILLRNRSVVFGSAETSASPVAATLKGESGLGTDVAGGAFVVQAGLGTGDATGGNIVLKTGQVGTTSALEHVSTTRLTIDTVGKAQFTGEVGIATTLSTTQTTVNLLDTTATTINMGGAATVVEIGAATGTTTVHNNVDIDLDLNVDGGDITTNATTFNLLNTNATTLNVGGAATTLNMGNASGTVNIAGNLTVNGTTTTVNSTTVTVDDKNIELGSVASPNNTTADGGGITLKGATDKTLNWVNSTAAWTSSENFNLASGKVYRINNASVLNSTTLGSAVVNSSLQTLGTINTGAWQGTIVDPTYGGTGINNGSKTITLGGNFTHTGAHTLGVTTTGATSITLPTSGTLAITGNPLSQFAATTSAQLAGIISNETGTGSLVFGTSPSFTTGINAASTTMALFNTTATTVNFAGAATNIQIGAATGTTNVNNNLDVDLDLNVDGGDITTNATTFNLINATATTVNFAKAATTLDIGAATGTTSINNNVDIDLDLNVDGGDITTNAVTFNLINTNTSTLNIGGAATSINIGAATSTTTITDDLLVNGNITIGAGGTFSLDSINNTPIGNTTPSSGAFTTLASSGLTTFTNNTASSGTSVGAVVITGGLGVGGDVHASSFTGSIAAANINSGTLADARIAVSNVTQHQLSITGTGALNAGSITSGFGSINIGSSIFTGDGSGLTTLNASNLAAGNVAGARLGGNQSMSGVKTFTDTTNASAYTTAAFLIQGGLGVALDIRTNGTIYGNGSGLTSLNATNLTSGTITDARLPTSQAGKTFTGDLTVNSHKVGRGGGNSATNLAVAGGQAISTGTDNSVFGVAAMTGIVTGNNNTAVGNSSLAALTSATHNTAVGNDSQAQRTTAGNFNTSVGAQSMSNSTNGSNNTGVGYQALELVTGGNNTSIGGNAGDSLTSGASNIIIGYNAQVTAATTSNEIVIGTATQNNLRIPGVNLTVNTTTFNFTGTTGYSGVGTNLTALNATSLTSGTVPDARIAATSITQHQASITGTGVLNSGSINTGFGNINIGTSTFTGNGSGLTTLNASNLSSGTVAGARLGGTQSMAGIKTFTDATDATTTANGAVRLTGGLSVAKAIVFGGIATGNGSGLTTLNATNLSSGTVANARISGTYSNLTGSGALNAGSITSGFGNINIGTSTFTGNGSGLTNVNADLLDGIDSLSFLRSNADDTATGVITLSGDNERLKIVATTATNSPYMGFYQGATRRAYIQMVNGGTLRLASDQFASRVDIGNGTTGLTYTDGTTWTVWHSGNDGAGSGLDADLLDGLTTSSTNIINTVVTRNASGNFAAGTITATLTGNASSASYASAVTLTADNSTAATRYPLFASAATGNLSPRTDTGFTYNPSTGALTTTTFVGALTGTASNANLLDNIDSTAFIRKDIAGDWNLASSSTASTYTGSALELREYNFGGAQADTAAISPRLGFHWGGRVASQITMTSNGWINIRNNPGTGYENFIAAGVYATGEITAYYSDERLKTKVGNIDNALDKVLSIETFLYKNNEIANEYGFSDDDIHVGVSAQSVERVLPEVVKHAPFDIQSVDGVETSKSGEWYKTVQYDKIVPLLIEAIKEQDAKAEAQALEIAELKAMVKALLEK